MEETKAVAEATGTSSVEDLGEEEVVISNSSEEKNDIETTNEEGSTEEETNPLEMEKSNEEQWVVPGRFRTAEDLAKSYQNLESAYGRSQSELSRIKQETNKPRVDPETEIKQFAEDLQKNGVGAIRKIARQEVDTETQKIRFESEYKNLMNNKEFTELEPTMCQIANEYNDMIQSEGLQNDPRLLHILFLAAKGVNSAQSQKNAEIRGKQKGEKTALKKTKVKIEGVSGTKGHTTRSPMELSLTELRKEIEKGNLG